MSNKLPDRVGPPAPEKVALALRDFADKVESGSVVVSSITIYARSECDFDLVCKGDRKLTRFPI